MFSSPLSHARVSHTRTASVKPSLLRPTHRAKRNDPHRRTTIAISPGPELRRSTSITIAIAPIGVDRDLAIDASRDRDRADRRRSRSSKSTRLRCEKNQRDRDLTENTICPSGFSHREIDLSFWVLFEFLGMNDIMCLFGS